MKRTRGPTESQQLWLTYSATNGDAGMTPKMLQKQISILKKGLAHKDLPFGVDLLLPQVGGSARKTNKDYTDVRCCC